MKAALYLRVSTDEQTVEPQRMELRDVCQRRGWTIIEEIEDQVSGAKVSRAGLDRLLGMVRKRSVQAVLCVKLDRLGRSLPHLVQVIAELDSAGVALVCPGQGIDTSAANPAGRLQMHVLAAVAEFERSLIVERTRAGMKAARARGAAIGRPGVKLPANWEGTITHWRVLGGTLKELAASLGVSVGTAHRLAKEDNVAELAERIRVQLYAVSDLPSCRVCQGEGQLKCHDRSAVVGREWYSVDCESCGNCTEVLETELAAKVAWTQDNQ